MKITAVTLTALTMSIPILCSFSMLGCSETETLRQQLEQAEGDLRLAQEEVATADLARQLAEQRAEDAETRANKLGRIAPYAEILDVAVEYNEFEDDRKGMRIYVEFKIRNFGECDGRCTADFYNEDGTPLRDFNGKYRTTTGNVSVERDFSPDWLDIFFSDDGFSSVNANLFMPYDELHINRDGKRNLKFRVAIYSKAADHLLALSDWESFEFLKGGN